MKTFIELDCLLMVSLSAPKVHFGHQNRLCGRFSRSTEAGVQPNAVNLVRPQCS